jgi:4-hydroxy-3-methylbut-2-enyl diphosphate reductase
MPAERTVSNLTVATALRIEAAAVRGVVGSPVTVVGMGPARASSRARRLSGDGPVALLGLAGGVGAAVHVGDVVVASEIRGDGVIVACPSAPLVAAALSRAGLRVHVGPVASQARLARGDDFARLAATGALAVDMESAAVAAAVGTRPFAVVRVVSDTAAAPLLRPVGIARAAASLATLRRAARVVAEWGAAVQARTVVLAAPRSFCAGVERAIDIVERALDRFGPPIYVRRQIVHNSHIVADLERRGAVFVDELSEVPERARVVFAAHGVAPDVRAEADDRGLSVVDATCPLVTKVHTEVRRYAARDHTVVLIGHRDHEEVVGTVGEAPGHVVVVEDERDAASVDVDDPERVAYVMQTTLAVDDAERIAEALRSRFPAIVGPRSDDICYATSNRQLAVRAVAERSDVVLVVGSANSSNSRRLVEVAERAGARAHLVDDVRDVDLRWLAGACRVGVTAGASAPPRLVDDLVDALAGLGPTTVTEHRTVTENVTFTLPREVS